MAKPISARQLVCLQAMWAARMRARGITANDSRELRHEYIAAATDGRARETKELSCADAQRVLGLLSRELGGAKLQLADAETARAAGTHGRAGHHDRRHQMIAGAETFALIERLRCALRWEKASLDAFVGRQLGGRPLHTMADANAVIWPMKRMLRSRGASARA